MSKQQYEKAPISAGDEVEVTIIDLAYGGDSVGRYKDFTVFVPYGVPGAVVRVKINEVKKNFALGRISRVVSESPVYTKPPCKYFGDCGGCDWMNLAYDSQAAHKMKIVKFMLEKTAGLQGVLVKDIIKYENPLHYRNRAQYKVTIENGTIKLGFYRARSHNVIGVDECLILHPKINEIAKVVVTALNDRKKEVTLYDEKTGRGCLRHVAIKVNAKGESLVTFVCADRDVKPFIQYASDAVREKITGLKGIVMNINLEPGNNVFAEKEKMIYGQTYITEHAAGMDFDLSSAAFFQVNAAMLEKMAGFVNENIKKGATVLDLYGGVGALTLPSMNKFREIFVVEIDNSAAQRLHDMTIKNNIRNVTVVNGRAEDAVDRFMRDARITDVVIDPPRKGIHPKILSALRRSSIQNIIYISCNPASFARDIKELKDNFYLREVQPLDQFPQTYHVELMAKLERKHGNNSGSGMRDSGYGTSNHRSQNMKHRRGHKKTNND
jgi:23S rRNA (uracil1939-C5)-methyltransferase